MADLTGYFNGANRRWTFPGQCQPCPHHVGLHQHMELLLRQSLVGKLLVEDDHFQEMFTLFDEQYPHFVGFRLAAGERVPPTCKNETDIVDFYLRHKLVLGVSLVVHPPDPDYDHFVLPIMKGGKMWQILLRHRRLTLLVNKMVWQSADENASLGCLVCTDHPFDVYPSNFVINEGVYSLRSILWPDHRRPHFDRKHQQVVVYDGTRVCNWPILSEAFHNEPINHLGNMAVFTTGEIFARLLRILLQRLASLREDNMAVQLLNPSSSRRLRPDDVQFLRRYYTTQGGRRFGESNVKLLDQYTEDGEDVRVLERLKRPKSRVPPVSIIRQKGMSVRRGEIDEAITQTRILHKDKGSGGGGGERGTKVNHSATAAAAGRFSKNVASNSYVNMCSAACGLQKVLPKDSKAMEPRTLDDSEVGFIDPLHTPDTPERCGILLETVPDVVVSTPSMCCADPVRLLLQPLFPDLTPVDETDLAHPNFPQHSLTSRYYILVNHLRMYSFTPPSRECHCHDSSSCYCLYFRTMFEVKCQVPCVELLFLISRASRQLWACNSVNRNLYKLAPDGLLYTSKEVDCLRRRQAREEGQWWWGLPNLMGPSAVSIVRPNAVHLPRLSNACCAMRHHTGQADNSRAVAEVHQKVVLTSYYSFRRDSTESLPIPAQYPLVCVANWANPEDAITIKGSSVQRGLFQGECYETFVVRFFGDHRRRRTLEFQQTYWDRRGPLRRGTQLGRVTGIVPPLETSVYCYGGEVECRVVDDEDTDHDSGVVTVSLTWMGKTGDLEEPAYDDTTPFNPQLHDERLVGDANDRGRRKRSHYSLAFREAHPNYSTYRCVDLDWTPLEEYPTPPQGAPTTTTYRFRVVVCSRFVPSVGDKLQTPTSQKGVIGYVVRDDADMPFVNTDGGESILPDMIINPHFIKRQAFDIFHGVDDRGGVFMEDCFEFDVEDTRHCLQLGEKTATGRLMCPYTGRSYNTPVSLFPSHYVNVTNHRPSLTMHSSRTGETVISEYSGAPVRGRRGGFAVGPMEHVSLSAAQRIDTDLTHMRSDYETVQLISSDGNECGNVGGSAAFRRLHDDWNLAELTFGFQCASLFEEKDETA